MKVIVAVIGSFMYVTNEPGISIVPERPTLVRADEFIRTLVLQKKIDHLGNSQLPDEATDAEWKKWFEDSGKNVDLAVSSFIDKWEGLDEKSLAQQARETNARLEQEARAQAEADNLAAQQLLMEQEQARRAAEEATAAANAEAARLAAETLSRQQALDAEARAAAEKAALEAANKKAEDKKAGK